MIEHATDSYRSDIRGLLTRLAGDTAVPDPATLGRQLHLIYDGAILSARMDRDPSIALAARAAVTALLDAALPSPDPRSTMTTDNSGPPDKTRKEHT